MNKNGMSQIKKSFKEFLSKMSLIFEKKQISIK